MVSREPQLRHFMTPRRLFAVDSRRPIMLASPSSAALTLRLSGEFGMESPRQALSPLGGFDAGLQRLSASLFKHFQAIAQRFPAVRDRRLDRLAVGHASQDIRAIGKPRVLR